MPKTEGSDADVHFVGSWFAVEIQGGPAGYFSEATGMAVEFEVTEWVQQLAGGDTMTMKRPGTAKYGEINLKRTLSKDQAFWLWAKDIWEGKIERKDGSLVMMDSAGAEVGRWSFLDAWPSKWSASDLDAGSDDQMMEEVTLQIEFIERVK